LEKYVKNKL